MSKINQGIGYLLGLLLQNKKGENKGKGVFNGKH